MGEIYSCYTPKSIYKYFKENELDIKAIDNDKMWYSIPANFNDPFDCSFYINKCFSNLIDSEANLRKVFKRHV